jgi:beta-glucosidase
MNTVKSQSRSILRTALLFLCAALCLIVAVSAIASAQQASPAEIDRRADEMLSRLTLEQKIKLIGGVDNMFTYAMPQIGLPRLKMSDGPMGVRTWGPTTGYAAGVGLASSWDIDLAREIGVSLGRDARSRGVNFLLGPGVDIYRAPMNGRNFEYFGEDPYLAGQIAAHYILGVQSQGVVATVKHYAANNSEYNRHGENAIIDERTLHEIYLPAYEAAVKEGHVGAVMDSYNLINGEHATENKYLDTEVLKRDWGFRGILMSDWAATYDGVAAANAGLDLEMPFARFMNEQTLLPAVKSGKVSEETINDKVRRILRVALEYGFLKNDQQKLDIPRDDPKSRAVALRSAEEGTVLLKNEGHLLPLDPSGLHTVAIIGPDAFPAQVSAGGSAHVTPFDTVSFLSGLRGALAPNTTVLWNPGVKDVAEILGRRRFSGPRSSAFSLDAAGTKPGLEQQEFDNGNITGKPDRVTTVYGVNHWGGFPFVPPSRKKLAVRWTGFYTPKTSGPTALLAAALGRDAYKLYVNGELVVDSGPGEGQPGEAVLNLPEGKPASVRLDYLPETTNIRAGFAALPAEELLDPDAKKIAALAQVVILSVGFDAETEGEGHDRTYSLPPGQEDLIKTVLSVNPHTVVVLTSGGSVATSGWIERVPALLQTWYAGSEGGRALAAALTGKVNPSGKLPITWWRRWQDNPTHAYYYEKPGSVDVKYGEGVFVGYRDYGRSATKPLFPFGYGLSYTDFSFSGLQVTPLAGGSNHAFSISFEVRNIGSAAGAEVAQVYVGDPSAQVPRPAKELKGFERVDLQPGASKRVTVKLNQRAFAYWDTDIHGWKVDPGKFMIYVGDSSENTPLTQAIAIQ